MNERNYKFFLAKKLEELRAERGLSLNQMAKTIGTNLNVYSRWEAGKSVPTAYSLYKIKTTLNLEWDDLLP